MPIFEQRGKSDVGARLYGLMALAADGGSKGHFSRIGVCNLVFYVENHQELMERLLVELDAFVNEGICVENRVAGPNIGWLLPAT